MKNLKFFIFILFLFLPKGYSQTLKIYWTDKPPVINGKMDDICWKQAEVAKDFTLFKKAGKPTQQTEVYICYDADNLYLLWKLYESNMDKLIYGPPEDMRDMLNFGGDVAELFLDPGATRVKYYQLCSSPLGTRYDMSTKKGSNFNPSWKIKTGIYKWGWIVEETIPFTELVHKDEYFSTPQIGEKWGINFCRDEGPLHEWSQWVPSMRSFHEVKNFGTAIFMGKRKGTLPEINLTSKELLFFGPGKISLSVNSPYPLDCTYILKNEGKTVNNKKIKVKNSIIIPYHITNGGKWELTLEIYENSKKIYKGKTFTILPHIKKEFTEIEEKTSIAKKQLGKFNHPVKKEIEKNINNLLQKISLSISKIKKAEELKKDDWKKLLVEREKIKDMWKSLKFDINLVKLYPQREKRIITFATGIAGPSEKIYPDTLYNGSLNSPVEISLAGNEYESFQILLIPFWKDINNLKIKFTDLQGRKGKISKNNFQIYEVRYIKLKDIDPDNPSLHKYEPDPLFPINSISLKKGKIKSIWVDFYLPFDTHKGKYAGYVIISDGKTVWKRKIVVNSYGFNLPKTCSLENQFWFSLYNWRNFYGELNYTPALYEKHAKILSKYRITSIPNDWITLWPQIKVYYEGKGHFSFDFSTLNKYIKIGLKYGSNSYWASLGCNLASLMPFSRKWTEVIDRKTGEKIKLSDIPEMKEWLEKWKNKQTYWDKNPMYRDYLKQYVENLKNLGIIDISYYEIYDEPNDNSRWLDMLRHHKFLKSYVPELKLFDFGVDPTQVKAGKSAVGYIDIWAPHLTALKDKKILNAIYEREKYGEKFWFYTCNEGRDNNGNYSPYLYYHRPYICLRIQPWFAWKLKSDGMFIYALSSVPKENIKKKGEKKWPEVDWLDGKYRGCGTLIYPGPDYQVITGMRLANLRDGLEDYEYFHILKKLSENLKNKNLLEDTKKELEISPEIIKNIYEWTKDNSVLNKKREKIAKLIYKIEKEVEK